MGTKHVDFVSTDSFLNVIQTNSGALNVAQVDQGQPGSYMAGRGPETRIVRHKAGCWSHCCISFPTGICRKGKNPIYNYPTVLPFFLHPGRKALSQNSSNFSSEENYGLTSALQILNNRWVKPTSQ